MAAPRKFPSPTHEELEIPCSPRPLYAPQGSKWYVCQVCGNTFDGRYALMGHMNAHRKTQPVVRCIRLFGVNIVVVEAGPEGVAE
jgi:hypothetical protein